MSQIKILISSFLLVFWLPQMMAQATGTQGAFSLLSIKAQ